MIPRSGLPEDEPRAWTFRVVGRPIGQGSMRERIVKRRKLGQRTHFTVHANSLLDVWRENVTATARAAGVRVHRLAPVSALYEVSLLFFLPRVGPMTALQAPGYRRDLDKLVRGVLDALKGTAWADDGQVVKLRDVEKVWATETEPPGVRVAIVRRA